MNVAKLQRRHQKLRDAVHEAQSAISFCRFKLADLKKKKLWHKDEIARRQRQEVDRAQSVAAE